ELKQELLRKENELESAAKQLEQHQAVVRMSAAARELALAEAQGALRKAKLKAETPADLSKAVDLEKAKLDHQLARAKVEHLQGKGKDAARKENAELAVLRDRRDRAKVRIDELKANIGRMRVKAKRAGTVVYRTNWRGEKPKVGDNAHRDRAVIEIAGAGGLRATGFADEVDLARIAVAQPVRIRLDAQPDVEYMATLSDIGDSIVRKSAENPVKVAKVELTLEQSNAEIMRPGMRYRGQIEVGRRKDVVLVPAAAVFVTAEGPVVYIETESGPREVRVEIGARNDEDVEVVSGLEPDARVSLVNLRGAQ
ncbi:MAG: HlyD family efflux transporter periplasmic adaptor subunit, partial [Deltaproteobacteria bacterium]|nr:HlyD family efflux transporter periplasmic adaptor subunit [Deltaproteobacteria bacterium]